MRLLAINQAPNQMRQTNQLCTLTWKPQPQPQLLIPPQT